MIDVDIEDTMLNTLRDRVIEAAPEFAGRIEVDDAFPLEASGWPCIRVQCPNTGFVHEGHQVPGKRRTKATALVRVSIIHDARDGSVGAVQRDIAKRIRKHLADDPYLSQPDGTAILSDLFLEAIGADTVAHRGAVVAVRQLIFSAQYRTRENNPAAPMHG